MGLLVIAYSVLSGVSGWLYGPGKRAGALKGTVPARTYTTRYDGYFQKYAHTYFGRLPWQWFKAQAIQESGLNPDARSPAGAQGIMQLMPATYNDIRKQLHLGYSAFNASDNIHAGIYYDLQCFTEWTERRSLEERIRLMLASYNAGLGSVLAAQRTVRTRGVCDGVTWDCIQQGLHDVTGSHADETLDYVERVEYYYRQL